MMHSRAAKCFWTSLTRHVTKQAVPTKATGTEPVGTVLAAGSLLRHQNGYEYMVQADAAVDEDGNITVDLKCTMAGMACNLLPDETLTLLETDTGLDAGFIVDEGDIVGGTDQEKDVEAAYRLQHRLTNPPRGSAPADYERWAMMVPGITRAGGVRNPFGATTAGIIIVADNNPDKLPTGTGKRKGVM